MVVVYGGHTNPLLLDNIRLCCLFKDSQHVVLTGVWQRFDVVMDCESLHT
ncbi:hypothetical protein L798_02956 [Zootermopsis nevadensis]|uniref:Uncharacterized protein n=1 Tax=Zootermopsis nevadensis TaxID=136037 RepID=A0A067QU37_ZOONE|nr:hypothetical protein L798_02956 [Zootermopsis nevadensis]